MSDLDTSEVETILQSAERHLDALDHQSAYDLLQPLHESGQVSGEVLGRTSWNLGEACLGLEALDAAMYYYEEAAGVASTELQQSANARIAEIGRRDDAVDAGADGVSGAGEADAVLAAAEDALANHDYDTARQFFTQAYDGIQMTPAQISRASIGLAACHLHVGETAEAEGFLQVAESAIGDPSGLTDRIADIRARATDVDAGNQAVADGVDRSELDEVMRAALAAGRSHDFEGAYRLLSEMYESSDIGGTHRGNVAHNLGLACLWTNDHDAAHQYFTEASTTATPRLMQRSAEMLVGLEQFDVAADLVAQLDPAVEFDDAD